jgi:hypothetical protein
MHPRRSKARALSTKTDDGAAVLLFYQPGTGFLSVRALRDDATGALNVVFRGQVFVLKLRHRRRTGSRSSGFWTCH